MEMKSRPHLYLSYTSSMPLDQNTDKLNKKDKESKFEYLIEEM